MIDDSVESRRPGVGRRNDDVEERGERCHLCLVCVINRCPLCIVHYRHASKHDWVHRVMHRRLSFRRPKRRTLA